MAADEDTIVSCTNAECLLRLRAAPIDLAAFRNLYPGHLGIALEVRPYGGHVLRHGNSDHDRQYGEDPPGASGDKGGYVRELKHDLLYMAYFGDRERGPSEEMGGAGVFEAMTVGAILALKFDLWFFYGVPITSDPEAAMISDEKLRTITLETFEGPIYFDLWAIGDNPVEPIYLRVILLVGAAVKGLGVALQKIAEGYAAYVEVLDDVEVSTKRRAKLRKRARRRFAEAMEWLEPSSSAACRRRSRRTSRRSASRRSSTTAPRSTSRR